MAFQRMQNGTPPFALQWHAGNALNDLAQNNLTLDLTPLATEMGWSSMLHSGVLPYLSRDDKLLLLPAGIHAENWAWFNGDLVRRYGNEAPTDWNGVEALLARSAAAGGPGIAMGTEPWQRMLLFSQILISEGGARVFVDLHEHGALENLEDPAIGRALEIFAALRRYDHHSRRVRLWRDGTVAVTRGEAIVQFMGDWVRPELDELGAEPGRDVECVLAIGRDKHHLSVIDGFVFPRQGAEGLSPEHVRFAAAALAPDTQLAFGRHKGAIPARSDLTDRLDDPCMSTAYGLFKAPGASIPASVMIAPARPLAGLINVVSALWDDRRMDIPTAISAMRRALTVTR